MARIKPKPDPAVPLTRARTVWVLVQTLPNFQVLAASLDRARIEQEAAELLALWTERGDARTFDAQVKPAHLLTA